jgi:energy-coupling factor transporter ATP-binding protein EcfA2
MQKLIITKQFMAVKPCKIELNRFLLLIGEQAIGKSTIAKLIYFFQTLPDAIYENSVMAHSKQEPFDFVIHINQITRKKFLETFGSTRLSKGFAIRYNYYVEGNESDNPYLDINQGSDGRAYATFQKPFGFEIGGAIMRYFNAPRLDSSIDEINVRQQLRHNLESLFNRETNTHTYLIAGRNTIVAYPETFEKVIEQEVEKLLEDEIKEQDFEKRQRSGNERLFYQFVQWSKGVKNNFKNNGQSFERASISLGNREATQRIGTIANKILKGNYESTQSGEQIKLEGSSLRISLKDASSGQQEVLRLLQGIFLSIGLQNRKEFFVVEEPEAHLYPLAQKELINAFAVFLNTISSGKMIVTTHSPYILACINILLFAHYVSNEIGQQNLNGAIATIPRAFWLDASMFNAYSLGHNSNYCVSIKDKETGLIDQNYLDTISEQLGFQYQTLYNLLTEQSL